MEFDPSKHNYMEFLHSMPRLINAVRENHRTIREAESMIMLLPCGNDAHADWAYAHGLGKFSIIIGHPKPGEHSGTHVWADRWYPNEDAFLANLSRMQEIEGKPLSLWFMLRVHEIANVSGYSEKEILDHVRATIGRYGRTPEEVLNSSLFLGRKM